MKIIAFIMAFLVLALSVMPCADAGAIEEGKVKSAISKTTDRQDHDDSDACSPFCHCSCCAGFSINHVIASIIIIPPYGCNPTGSFLPANVTEVVLPIWEPPQIV